MHNNRLKSFIELYLFAHSQCLFIYDNAAGVKRIFYYTIVIFNDNDIRRRVSARTAYFQVADYNFSAAKCDETISRRLGFNCRPSYLGTGLQTIAGRSKVPLRLDRIRCRQRHVVQ